MKHRKTETAFTLIEILVVIGIIAILAAIVITAVNPARQFQKARNVQRRSHLNAILNAVYQYSVDNRGRFPDTITATETEICRTGAAPADCQSAGLIDLSVLTNNELYLMEMPIDPSCPNGCASDGTGYNIATTIGGRVLVAAPRAELGEIINLAG